MLSFACIAPHGGELIPELANGNLQRMARTRNAMFAMGQACAKMAPETIVVLTPHGILADDHVCVSVTDWMFGTLGDVQKGQVTVRCEVDVDLAESIAETAVRASIPVAKAAFEKSGRRAKTLHLDWGALVPLYFLAAAQAKIPRVVVVCPCRNLSRSTLVGFGEKVVLASQTVGRRIALVCSADQGHGHDPSGPYGFAQGSVSYDRAYLRAVKDHRLDRLLYWRNSWIDAALADSYCQTLILWGALRGSNLWTELLSYEVPTYFGMLCAQYLPPSAGVVGP